MSETDATEETVLVSSYSTDGEAALAVGTLRAAGIDATLVPASALGAAGGIQESRAGVLVPSGDAAEALVVLGRGAPSSSAAALSETGRSGFPRLATAIVVALIAMTSVVLALKLHAQQRLLQDSFNGPYDAPHYDEKLCLVYPWRGTATRAFASCDDNGDRRPDVDLMYDGRGRLHARAPVAEPPGPPPEATTYDISEAVIFKSIDRNRDGIVELTIVSGRSGAESVRIYDDDEDGRPDRWVELKGPATETWTDHAGDGSPDLMERFSPDGKLLQRMRETAEGWVIDELRAPDQNRSEK